MRRGTVRVIAMAADSGLVESDGAPILRMQDGSSVPAPGAAAIRAVMPMSARHLTWAWEGQPHAARLPFVQRPRRVPELEPLGAL